MISASSTDLRSLTPENRRAGSLAETLGSSKDPAATAGPISDILLPFDVESLQPMLYNAYQNNRAIYPMGGSGVWGCRASPAKPGIACSMMHLNRVIDYPADDLTVTVQAGITLAELNQHLAENRQWLPIDAPEPETASIGGVIATNAYGPRRHGYGTIGDYLIGFRALDGRGEAFCGGGKVVKNAAGYNLPRLMVGAHGTLGLIVEATFMVRPLPTHSALIVCDVFSFEQVESLLAGFGASLTAPTIVELLAGPARPNCPVPAMLHDAAARLVVGFEGGATEVQAMQAALGDEWNASGAGSLTTIAGAGVATIFHWLSASPALLQFNILPSRLVALLEQIARHLPAHPMQAHATSGVIKVFPAADGAGNLATNFVEVIRDTLRPLATAAGGHLTVLSAPDGVSLAAADIWGPPRAGAALMRAIQQRFDPAGILNPGRFAFGGL